MSMGPAEDASAADWIVQADLPWYVVATYGPPGLAEYARIELARDDEFRGEEIDLDGCVDPDRARWESVLNRLSTFTATPELIHVGLWDGTGTYTTVGPYFGNAGRRYALMSGTLAGALDRKLLSDDSTRDSHDVPHLTWPHDRAWIVARDTDEERNFTVGGAAEAIRAVLAVEGIRGVTVPYGTPESGWTW